MTLFKAQRDNLDAPLVLAFPEHVAATRRNSVRTPNARPVAVQSLFRFMEYRPWDRI